MSTGLDEALEQMCELKKNVFSSLDRRRERKRIKRNVLLVLIVV